MAEVDEAVEREKSDPTGGRGTDGEMDKMLNAEAESERELLQSAV